MNLKEKILFIASKEYVEKLNEHNLDFENHNRLFWCHVAALSFISTGIAEFNLDLNYAYQYEKDKEGVVIVKKAISFYTTTQALIEFNLRTSRSSTKINNSILGQSQSYSFRNKMENYLDSNLKLPTKTQKEHDTYSYNTLFLKFRIHNRKSEETQNNFLTLLNEQCPELNYFLSYLKTKEKLVEKNTIDSPKKLKI